MAKSSGLGDRFFINGYDLSGDVNALSKVGGGAPSLNVTAINGSAMERIGGIRDGEMSFTSIFNDAAARSHIVLSALSSADGQAIYMRGASVGSFAAGLVHKQIDYSLNRGADASLIASVQLQANAFGIEWCQALTAGLKTDTAAANGTSIDYGAVSTLFGASAYAQVTSFTGTSITLKVQDSADNVTFADITGLTFTVVSAAPAFERLQTATGATIRRYVRAISTGTFNPCSFVVVFERHLTSTL